MARKGKAAVVGAGFPHRWPSAQRPAEHDVCKTAAPTDLIQCAPEGLALDMNQSR